MSVKSTLTVLAILALVSPRAGATPRSFAREARAIHQMAACARGELKLPRRKRRVVRRHCREMRKLQRRYRWRWFSRARTFFTKHVPRGLPATVVYPFGGADLPTLLTVFPDATEYTSISLELSGDPRRLPAASPAALARSLSSLRKVLGYYFWNAHHVTRRLTRQTRTRLPPELGIAMVALAVHGYRPVDLRYFTLAADGSISYYTAAHVEAARAAAARRRLFANMELTFRRPNGSLKVYRHFVQDLSDKALQKDTRLLLHLRAKGEVTAVVKAGSFLLAMRAFSSIREYMLKSTSWMVSDTTGPTPRQARAAGLEQVVYGRYEGAFLPMGRYTDDQFRKLFSSQPRRRLRFRFGYPDNSGLHRNHLIITRKRRQAP